MNRDTQRLLRIIAVVVVFVVGLVLVWNDPSRLVTVDARWADTCLFGGLALFALSFATA